ncbi:ATP-binding cassette domain-containing protein [Vibrio splendidus]|uniref:ATP-binding cassette domain-containing protein n=1 Tax=Vibrio splendidus TaxID=29497 RepID=UPI000C8374B0|nr:ATP-binding cassette domain-containing protein [Vibrio splendidus]PMG18796.1 ABC transporter ATP-binding protein [Vibrio splendidus]
MNAPLLSVDQLTIKTSSRTLFQDIHFDVYRGELLAIMGPSGIGKSMLSRAIAGFLPDTVEVEGHISLSGDAVCGLPMLQRAAAQRPAVIFQDALQALNPLVSIEGQLSLALTGTHTKLKSQDKIKLTELLVQLGFPNPETILPLYPSQISGGQRQRICIAIGLLSNADLIIADEPTSALDPVTEQEILKLIRDNVKQRQIGGLLITHDLHSALACDKLLVIDDGGVVAYGAPKHALESSSHAFCCSLRDLIE